MSELAYHSAIDKTEEQAQQYSHTHQAPHRFLAYRDIPEIIETFSKGNQALDFGCGAGASSEFLCNLGLDVTGVDISTNMLEQAKVNFPNINFRSSINFTPSINFDLIFSSFVLFELPSKEEIIKYLEKAHSMLKHKGIFIGITGSEHLYSISSKWFTFDVNFIENYHLYSGKLVKLSLKSPRIEFFDYYWKEKDYLECFRNAGFQILKTYFPLGFPSDPYPWKDELLLSPFVVFVAQKCERDLDFSI